MKRIAMVLFALAASVLLVACGSSNNSSTTSDTGGSHNAADVTFAQDMIPHHRQAVEMAEMAAGRASAPEIKALASRIQAAQDPEIETMGGWLRAWGKEVPSSSNGAGHGGHSSMSMMPGMMSSDDMQKLMAKSGIAFDQMFLEMMTEHHQGAIEMARTEQSKGSYGAAKELAAKIVTDQQTEIDQMTALLAKL